MVGMKSEVNWESVKENNITFSDIIITFLIKSGTVCMVAANKKEAINKVYNPDAPFIVLIATTDIQLPCQSNLCVGTSWMIFRRSEESRKQLFDREAYKGGRKGLHAGLLVNGCNTVMSCAFKELGGIHYFIFDMSTGDFGLVDSGCFMRQNGNLLCINEALFYKFSPSVQLWLKQKKKTKENREYYSRYTGGWLTDGYRILRSGGLLLSPEDSEDKDGRVRYLCTAVPLSFLVEKAGGKASDGRTSILRNKHLTRPRTTRLVLGSVGEVNDYIEKVESQVTKKIVGHQNDTENDDTSTDLNE